MQTKRRTKRPLPLAAIKAQQDFENVAYRMIEASYSCELPERGATSAMAITRCYQKFLDEIYISRKAAEAVIESLRPVLLREQAQQSKSKSNLTNVIQMRQK